MKGVITVVEKNKFSLINPYKTSPMERKPWKEKRFEKIVQNPTICMRFSLSFNHNSLWGRLYFIPGLSIRFL